jgi:L-lactate dehydrogenase complex protein LldG
LEKAELIEQFTEVAIAAGSTVECCQKSAAALNKALVSAIAGYAPVVFAQPDDLPVALFQEFLHKSQPLTKPDENQLQSASVGITDAFAGVARTGSVCVTISPRMSSAYSLYARRHIAVIDASTIVARPRDIFVDDSLRAKAIGRSFILVSGPSATADMGPLVRGVHGPGHLHIVILD